MATFPISSRSFSSGISGSGSLTVSTASLGLWAWLPGIPSTVAVSFTYSGSYDGSFSANADGVVSGSVTVSVTYNATSAYGSESGSFSGTTSLSGTFPNFSFTLGTPAGTASYSGAFNDDATLMTGTTSVGTPDIGDQTFDVPNVTVVVDTPDPVVTPPDEEVLQEQLVTREVEAEQTGDNLVSGLVDSALSYFGNALSFYGIASTLETLLDDGVRYAAGSRIEHVVSYPAGTLGANILVGKVAALGAALDLISAVDTANQLLDDNRLDPSQAYSFTAAKFLTALYSGVAGTVVGTAIAVAGGVFVASAVLTTVPMIATIGVAVVVGAGVTYGLKAYFDPLVENLYEVVQAQSFDPDASLANGPTPQSATTVPDDFYTQTSVWEYNTDTGEITGFEDIDSTLRAETASRFFLNTGEAWVGLTLQGDQDLGNINDVILGGAGNDTISGGAGNDLLVGSTGNDSISGGTGSDLLEGGAGADTLDGGAGTDTASYSDSNAGVIVNLATGAASGGHATGDTLSNIENLLGSVFGDMLVGDSASNGLTGDAGNDLLRGQGGNDTLDGGAGLDVAQYAASRSMLTITSNGGGSYTVNAVSSGEGTDQLTDVERLQISDGVIALDISGNAGQTYRLYQASFARTPDTPGLSHNVNVMDNGVSLYGLSAAFLVSAEFVALYGANSSNATFIDALYQNVLGRGADPAGFSGWNDRLISGEWDRADVLIGFSESLENIALVGSAIENGIWLG